MARQSSDSLPVLRHEQVESTLFVCSLENLKGPQYAGFRAVSVGRFLWHLNSCFHLYFHPDHTTSCEAARGQGWSAFEGVTYFSLYSSHHRLLNVSFLSICFLNYDHVAVAYRPFLVQLLASQLVNFQLALW